MIKMFFVCFFVFDNCISVIPYHSDINLNKVFHYLNKEKEEMGFQNYQF